MSASSIASLVEDWFLHSPAPSAATVVAACVAAGSSVANLAITIFATRKQEWRKAYRDTLNPLIHELGDVMHQVIAISVVLSKKRTEETLKPWRGRAADAKGRLKSLQRKLRYPLGGVTDAMGHLSRLPDWVEHARPISVESEEQVISAGRALGTAIDDTVRSCFVKGRYPTRRQLWRVKRASRRFERVYSTMGREPE